MAFSEYTNLIYHDQIFSNCNVLLVSLMMNFNAQFSSHCICIKIKICKLCFEKNPCITCKSVHYNNQATKNMDIGVQTQYVYENSKLGANL